MTRPIRRPRAPFTWAALLLLVAGAAVAQLPPLEALEARASALASEPDLTQHARGALSQATRALARCRSDQTAGETAAASRASRIAAAALTLAERRLAQARAQGELAFRARRADELAEERQDAEDALRVERARLDELRAAFAAEKETSDAVGP